jgi:uncharacterized membrane protein (UPF0182 family)
MGPHASVSSLTGEAGVSDGPVLFSFCKETQMSREDWDIPEVFRRAMENGAWTEEDDNGRGGRPRPPRRVGPSWGGSRFTWIIAVIVLLLASVGWIINTYTEWLWFTELDFQSVWLKQWTVRIISFVVAFVIAAVVLLLNWLVARRRAIAATLPTRPQFLRSSGVKWVVAGAALFLAFIFASTGSGQWEEFLRYVYRVSFGINDPIFNQDISFYLFELPVYTFLQGWAISLLVVSLLGISAIYAINHLPEIQQGLWRPDQSPTIRQHVALIGALILGLWALGYWFSTFGLLYSDRGVVFGASYTDLNASLWALRVQLVLMALVALAFSINVFRLSWRPVLALGGLWLVVTILGGGIYPGLLQRYAVEPNEIVRESPYIAHNIEFTRLAFGLEDVETRPFDNITDLQQHDLDENAAIVKNIRLWDYRPLQATYEQLQALRPYYQFGEVDIDRYIIDGEQRQVMLGTRELDKANLQNPTWVNENLEFTHGYGIVMNPVDKVTTEGQPEFFIQDLPPKSNIALEVTRPEIYYGELDSDEVFVSSGREEFSYPSGDENVYSSYEGQGGVPLDSYLKRLAFAIRLGETNVLLSDEIDSGTKIQLHRQIEERVRQITPFLFLDSDPYIVLWDGRLVWMMDAYTLSDKFPYSTPIGGNQFNYIRNAAKITVDAYHGTVTYYIADEQDPLIRTYSRAFPDLFHPLGDMPEGLQAHIRYPEDLFRVQTQQYLTYHMSDVRVFYNREDLWQIPQEIFDGGEQEIEPYYVTMSLPGETAIEYLLIQPYTPAGKNNMVAWIAARNDIPHYGELIAYELGKQELVFGPIQVEGRIDQEPSISEQFSLWNQRGSRVIRGNLLVIPVNDSFLYVEPVYLLSDTSALPELKRVIVASGTRIAMGLTLNEALDGLLAGAPAVIVEDTTEVEEIVTEEPAEEVDQPAESEASAPSTIDESVEQLINSANAHFEAAEAAQRAGDWSTYGEELDALQRDLDRLMELTGTP